MNAKKPLRALFFLSSIELVLYLVVATVAWAVADHDLATLQSSFFSDVQTRLHAQILGGVQIVIFLVNALMFLRIMREGEKTVAIAGAAVALGVVALYFLPTAVSVYGLGGLLGLVILWKIVSWPFKKIFGRKAKDADAPQKAAAPPAPPKKAG